MKPTILAIGLFWACAPAFAQAPTGSSTPLSAEQTTAFNSAIAEFTAGQKAQQAGDNASAFAAYDRALPAIRSVVATQPDKLDNVRFLANVLYVAAVAKAGTQNVDAAIPLLEESLPHWRRVVAESNEATSRDLLANILTQLGNAKLGKQDKPGALPFYTEAVGLARTSVKDHPDAATRNLLLGALIGASQAGEDPAIKSEVSTLSKSMVADGTVSAANRPAAEILARSVS